jgi:hypothetical protein
MVPSGCIQSRDLTPEHRFAVPALIVEAQNNHVVSADFNASVDGQGNILANTARGCSKDEPFRNTPTGHVDRLLAV